MTAGAVSAAVRYDAYVSYAEADREWVEDVLATRLAGVGARAFLEHDLEPGAVEIEARSRALAESRKTLVVVSDAYLEGRWSLLEEAMTLELDPAAQKRRLIPILRTDREPPLRIRPLVAVDLRGRGDAVERRQWERLLEAVDPRRPDPTPTWVGGMSLRLAEATGDLVRPAWHPAGAIWLVAAYLALAAAVALGNLVLRESPALAHTLTLLFVTPPHALAALAWREDQDVLRRLSHLAARRRGARLAVALLATATFAAWWVVGLPAAREVYCGPWGCKERDVTYLTIADFESYADGPEARAWAGTTRQILAQKLESVGAVRVFGHDLPNVDDETRRRLDVDFHVVGHYEAGPTLTAAFWQRGEAQEPQVTVAGAGGTGVEERMALQSRLALAILERLGVAVEGAAESRLAATPTASPRAAELNDEAFALLRRGRFGEAEERLRQALDLDPAYAVAWSNLAEVAARSGRYLEALAHRRRAVDRLPTYAPFHYNLGHLLAVLGRDGEALAPLETAARLDRAHVETLNELGKVRLALGDPAGAARDLEKAALLDPRSPAVAKNLGRARLAAGEPADAARELARAVALYPRDDWLGHVEARSLLVEAAVRRGDDDAACRELAALRAVDPDRLSPWDARVDDLAVHLPCRSTARPEDLHA